MRLSSPEAAAPQTPTGDSAGPHAPPLSLPADYSLLAALFRGALAVTEGLAVEDTLERIVAVVREVTGARYAACGVPEPTGYGFRHFIYSGVDAATAARIGHPPDGRGLLGTMLQRSEPLRLDAIDDHASSAGFPAHHPAMTTFLGVPIVSRGRNIGDIYLCDKEDATPFTAEDEMGVRLLAGFAAVAITNAYQYLQVNSELEQRTEELEETTETLRALSNRVLWMLESERRLLAQELHDGIGQALAAAALAADAIAEERLPAQEGAVRLRRMLRDAVRDVRRLSHGLRPSVLDELGPVAAVRAIAEQMDADRRGRIGFHVEGTAERLPEPVETVIYRVAQEALTNAVRHSGAAKMGVTLRYTPVVVELVVEDNGIGFDVTAARKGLGMAGMQERAALVNGTLQVTSRPGRGARIVLTVPRE